jgi:hypothetical protein
MKDSKAKKLIAYIKNFKELQWRECWACIDIVCWKLEGLTDKEIDAIFTREEDKK